MEENMAILIPGLPLLAEHTVKAAKNGDTVVTTIDVSLQKIVEDKILAFNQAHAGEARSGEPEVKYSSHDHESKYR